MWSSSVAMPLEKHVTGKLLSTAFVGVGAQAVPVSGE